MHATADASNSYRLSISLDDKTVTLGNILISAVDGLDKTIKLDIISKDDIIDACVDNKRCMVNRMPEIKDNFCGCLRSMDK